MDTRISQKLSIEMHITFPHLRCEEVSIDTVDSAGDNQVDVHGGIQRLPVNRDGELSVPELVSEGDCLSCMEAEDAQHKCCNTCEELKLAYHAKDLPLHRVLATAEQCKNEVGCQVCGRVVVKKVSGNVHMALGSAAIHNGRFFHDIDVDTQDISEAFNTSHVIHSITFGSHVPGVLSPLDGTEKIVTHGAYMFHYYIKLVPTVIRKLNGDEIYTHQYSVTDSARNVQVRTGELSGLPGVFIVYDFSPFLMEKTERARPWSYIFTSICAIVGGVFSIASIVEMMVHNAACRMFIGRC